MPIRSPSIEADKRPQKTARSHIRKPPLRHTAQGGKIHAMVFTHPTALPVRAYAPYVLLQFIISISDLQEFFRYFWNFIEKRRESAKRGSFDRRRCLAEAYSDSPAAGGGIARQRGKPTAAKRQQEWRGKPNRKARRRGAVPAEPLRRRLPLFPPCDPFFSLVLPLWLL